MGFNVRDIPSQTFTVTNYSEDLSISSTEAGTANVAAVLTTLISELNKLGIIEAAITT